MYSSVCVEINSFFLLYLTILFSEFRIIININNISLKTQTTFKMHIIEQAKSLLDFNQKLDISLLDGIVNLMYTEHGDVVIISLLPTITLEAIVFFILISKNMQVKF